MSKVLVTKVVIIGLGKDQSLRHVVLSFSDELAIDLNDVFRLQEGRDDELLISEADEFTHVHGVHRAFKVKTDVFLVLRRVELKHMSKTSIITIEDTLYILLLDEFLYLRTFFLLLSTVICGLFKV